MSELASVSELDSLDSLNQNGEGLSAQSEESSEQDYDNQRLEKTLKQWYERDIMFRFDFPEDFNQVPSIDSADQAWAKPMDYNDVAGRLLGRTENDGPDQLPPAIIQYFTEIVDFASKKFADLREQLSHNEHHFTVLKRVKDEGKLPHFLQLKSLEVKFFPEDEAADLHQEYRKILDEAATQMLDSTLKKRESLGKKLRRRAEELIEEVEKEAMSKWIEAQGTQEQAWNRWDHLFRVTAIVKRGEDLINRNIPLSTVVFRTALRSCRSKVSLILEAKRQMKTEMQTARRNEEKTRRSALAQASTLPRQEAEKRIERQIEDMLEPLRNEILSIKEHLRKNEDAPAAADVDGAATGSATKSRKSTHRQEEKDKADASSESKTRRKAKRMRRTADAQEATATSLHAHQASATHRADRPRGTESNGGGSKARKRKRKRAAGRDQE